MQTRSSLSKASQPETPVNIDVPAGACDCHTHIHGDPGTFPFFAGRTYTPGMALPEEMVIESTKNWSVVDSITIPSANTTAPRSPNMVRNLMPASISPFE